MIGDKLSEQFNVSIQRWVLVLCHLKYRRLSINSARAEASIGRPDGNGIGVRVSSIANFVKSALTWPNSSMRRKAVTSSGTPVNENLSATC